MAPRCTACLRGARVQTAAGRANDSHTLKLKELVFRRIDKLKVKFVAGEVGAECVVKAHCFFPDLGHLLVLLNNITNSHWKPTAPPPPLPAAFYCNWAHLVETAQIHVEL